MHLLVVLSHESPNDVAHWFVKEQAELYDNRSALNLSKKNLDFIDFYFKWFYVINQHLPQVFDTSS